MSIGWKAVARVGLLQFVLYLFLTFGGAFVMVSDGIEVPFAGVEGG